MLFREITSALTTSIARSKHRRNHSLRNGAPLQPDMRHQRREQQRLLPQCEVKRDRRGAWALDREAPALRLDGDRAGPGGRGVGRRNTVTDVSARRARTFVSRPAPQTTVRKARGATISQKKRSSIRYSCPACKIIVRATKQVNAICGECMVQLESEAVGG